MVMMLDATEKQGILTTVYPVVNGNGANYIAMNLAYAAREIHEHAKIAVVDFDFSNPYLGIGMHDDRIHGIDNLIDKLNGDFLDVELFEENMITLKEDIKLLRGTQMGRFYNMVRQEHLEAIIALLKQRYDYIFIAANADATDGGTSMALFHADNIVVLGRYNYKNYFMAQKTVQNLDALSGSAQVGVLYNLFNGQNSLDFSEHFSEWTVFGTVPYLPDTIDNGNLTGRGLQIVKRSKRDEAKETYLNVLTAFGV